MLLDDLLVTAEIIGDGAVVEAVLAAPAVLAVVVGEQGARLDSVGLGSPLMRANRVGEDGDDPLDAARARRQQRDRLSRGLPRLQVVAAVEPETQQLALVLDFQDLVLAWLSDSVVPDRLERGRGKRTRGSRRGGRESGE